MLLLCLCTLAGAYSLILAPQLPAPVFFQASLVVAISVLPFGSWRPVAGFLIGFAVMGFSALEQKSDQLDPVFQGEAVTFSARVEDFPVSDANSIRFIVRPLDRDSAVVVPDGWVKQTDGARIRAHQRSPPQGVSGAGLEALQVGPEVGIGLRHHPRVGDHDPGPAQGDQRQAHGDAVIAVGQNGGSLSRRFR